jgi:hypothetical protein
LAIPGILFLLLALVLGMIQSFGALSWNRYKAKTYLKEFRAQFERELSKYTQATLIKQDTKSIDMPPERKDKNED